jgi:saccharopine dehydrogenase-like NADP-dependent oxidoreductase
MADAVLIVGGYGAVGTVIATTLARQHAGQLIIAGRSAAKAAKLAAQLGTGVRWRVLDMTQPMEYDAILEGVGYVVMCLDVPDIEFVRQCFQRGIHYVDISAEYPILSAIAELDAFARQQGATAVLSVGLVPGLSNLMARHSLRFVQPVYHLDIAVLAGLGEKHGAAGSAWILNHMSDSAGMARFQFREPYGQKVVYRFAFSDQYTLPQTLPVTSAATWLGFDSFLMTHLIGLARLPVLRHLFQQKSVKRLLLHTTQRLQFGSDEFVLTTRARGGAGSYQAWLRGKREAVATGLVAAAVVHRLLIEPPPVGVYHIEQVFQLEDFLPLLAQHGLTFSGSDG